MSIQDYYLSLLLKGQREQKKEAPSYKAKVRNYRRANPTKSIGIAKNPTRVVPKEIAEMSVWD